MTVGQGIAQGAQNFAQGLDQYFAGAAKAKALRTTISAYAGDDDQGKAVSAWAHTASLPELEGYMQGQVQKQQKQLMMARLQDYNAQAQERQAQVTAGQQAGQILKRYGELTANTPAQPGVNVGDEEGDTPQDTPGMEPSAALHRALSEMPANFDAGRAVPKVLDSLARWNQVAGKQEQADDSTPTSMTMPDGGVVYYQPKTKNPITVSPISKANAFDAQKEEGPVYSPDGKMFWSGKGWSPLKDMGYPEGSTVKTINGVNAVVGPSGQILKTIGPQSAWHALGGDGAGNGTGSGTNQPPAATVNALKVGKYTVKY